jgi:hypothetical protein
MTVGLTEDVRKRIIALVGLRRMAQFIREAVERELQRRESLTSAAPVSSDGQPIPPNQQRSGRARKTNS